MFYRICFLSTAGVFILALLSLSGCCAPLDNACRLEQLGHEPNEAAMEVDTADTGVNFNGGGVDLLTIQMPFAKGYDSLCTQGANGSYSHGARATRYDVDFDTPNNATDPLYAPVAGTAYNHDQSRTKNFGYHVSIDVGDGTYIIIAHLDSIVITDGEQVAAGQLIGYEGSTGMANGDHIHIGRHSGDATKKGEFGTSINALAFNAYDTNTGAVVTKMTTELTCDLTTGHTYRSLLSTPLWHPSGSLLKSPNSSTVYLLNGFTLEPFLTEDTFLSRNYSWNDVVYMEDDEKACYAMGANIANSGFVAAVYDRTAYTGAWLLVGTATDPNRYRQQILSSGATAVLNSWGISSSSLTALPEPSSLGASLNNYPWDLSDATFRDGSLLKTTEASDVYVMVGGAALPIVDWDTYLLMGNGHRTINEISKADFDRLVSIVGDCATNSYCLSNSDVTTCGGDTEDVPGTYPGEGTGGVDDTGDDSDGSEQHTTDNGTGIGLELWWFTESSAEWITISGEFTNENGYGYGWNSNIDWSTWSDELYFSIVDAGSGDSFRYSYGFVIDGVENWSCLGPFPPGDLTGTAMATYNGSPLAVEVVADPSSDGCGLEVTIP